MSTKADLLAKLAEYYQPELRRTWFAAPVAEARKEAGLRTDIIRESEVVPPKVTELQEKYPPITVVCRHLYSHEAEIVEERAREVMRAVIAEHEKMTAAEAIAAVDDLVTDFLLLRQGQFDGFIGSESKPDPEYLRRFRGLWEVSLGYAAIRYSGDERETLLNTYLIAKGKHPHQVYVSDEEVELTEEEQARFASDGELDPDDQVALEQEKQKVVEEHKRKIREELFAECKEARVEAEKLSNKELKVMIGRKCGVQKALEAAQQERQVQRLFFVIRDPDKPAKEKVGQAMLDGYARFFRKISPHPSLRKKDEETEPDFSDIRYVSEDQRLEDFWNFLLDLDNQMTLCKTQDDVERLANTRPFRDDGAASGVVGDRLVGGVEAADDTSGASGDSGKARTKKATPRKPSPRRKRRNSKTIEADEEVSEGHDVVEDVL